MKAFILLALILRATLDRSQRADLPSPHPLRGPQEGNALEEEVAALLQAAGAASAKAVQEAEEKLAMKVSVASFYRFYPPPPYHNLCLVVLVWLCLPHCS